MKFFILILLFHYSLLSEGQSYSAPRVEWQKCIGGSYNDYGKSIIVNKDGTYTLLINSTSSDGDIKNNYGSQDIILMKLANDGKIVKQENLGGELFDDASTMILDKNGNYVIGGITTSSIYTSSYNTDCYLVRTDTAFNILDYNIFGGSDRENISQLLLTKNKDLVIMGNTKSSDGYFLDRNYYSTQIFISLYDSNNHFRGNTYFGNLSLDYLNRVIETDDNSFILGGTAFYDPSLQGFRGDVANAWIFDLKPTYDGCIWNNYIGGSNNDIGVDITINTKNMILFLLMTSSKDYDISCNHSNHFNDISVFAFNKKGENISENCYGGNRDDYPRKIIPLNDGGYVILGTTSSNNGDVYGCHNDYTNNTKLKHDDLWLFRADSNGKILWQKCLGGYSEEMVSDIKITPDKGFIIVGSTKSNDGDVSGNHSSDSFDAWVIKLSPETVGIEKQINSNNLLTLYPNPTQNTLHISTTQEISGSLCLQDISGKQILQQQNFNTNQTIDVANLAKGIYIITLKNNAAVWHGKFVKE
ncbi:MAG: T9SS type A sorting domain-containing protein [Bacteroidetes bacterium]|nr:T9SS type A sorting domain-containing protein [Bacteroidota bacterium]